MTASSKLSILPARARLTPRRSAERGHFQYNWLSNYYTFDPANKQDPRYARFGSIRVLNEDRVAPSTGFPTHSHHDAEIISYIVSGELTHRDSMVTRGQERESHVGPDDFYRMQRNDVQFTTGGSGISHSEHNERTDDWVHFIQIWVEPWKKGLIPRYHTKSFVEAEKRKAIIPIMSPLSAGPNASTAQEWEANATLRGTIPVHADVILAATIVPPGKKREYTVGGVDFGKDIVAKTENRRIYIHLIMTNTKSISGNEAKLLIDGREELCEGDGIYVEYLQIGDHIRIDNIGSSDAEFVLLDSD